MRRSTYSLCFSLHNILNCGPPQPLLSLQLEGKVGHPRYSPRADGDVGAVLGRRAVRSADRQVGFFWGLAQLNALLMLLGERSEFTVTQFHLSM